MKREHGLRLRVAWLISLMAFSLTALYIPHHHHDGKICVDESETSQTMPAHQDEGHAEQLDIQVQKILTYHSNNNQTVISSILSDSGHVPSQSKILYVTIPTFSDNYSSFYKVRTHKLRGSPIFS